MSLGMSRENHRDLKWQFFDRIRGIVVCTFTYLLKGATFFGGDRIPCQIKNTMRSDKHSINYRYDMI